MEFRNKLQVIARNTCGTRKRRQVGVPRKVWHVGRNGFCEWCNSSNPTWRSEQRFQMSTYVSSFDSSMEAGVDIDFLLLRKVAMLWAEEVEGITQRKVNTNAMEAGVKTSAEQVGIVGPADEMTKMWAELASQRRQLMEGLWQRKRQKLAQANMLVTQLEQYLSKRTVNVTSGQEIRSERMKQGWDGHCKIGCWH